MNNKENECPHCGSDKEPFMSRVEPMGFYCIDCGEDFDSRPDCGEDIDACPECLEQARLLGIGAEREADLRGELERERALADRLAGALMVTRWDSYTICKDAIFAWKEVRSE